LSHLAERADDAAVRFLDLCTGSGCVAITLALERPPWTGVASDLSQDAMAVAKLNAQALKTEGRLDLRQGDLFEPIADDERFDLILANPPYIMPRDMDGLPADVKDHEPHAALVGEGEDGLGHHRRILKEAAGHLNPGGAVMLELGMGQEDKVAALDAPGLVFSGLVRDLADLGRVAHWRTAQEG
jgi:release factor glutamine methyltransferase